MLKGENGRDRKEQDIKKEEQVRNREKKRKIKITVCLSLLFAILVFWKIEKGAIRPGKQYDLARELYYERNYEEAAEIFLELGDYKAAEELAQHSLKKLDEEDQARRYELALLYLEQGSYEEAGEVLTNLGAYKNSEALLKKVQEVQTEKKYQNAIQLIEDGYYNAGIEILSQIGDYKDSEELIMQAREAQIEGEYQKASELIANKQYSEGAAILWKLGDYKDSKEIIQNVQPFIDSNPQEGDIIYFGRYEQDHNLDNGKEEIAWVVLTRYSDDYGKPGVKVVSLYGLDYKAYDEKNISSEWLDSTLYKWLNSEFLQEAFTKAEQDRMYIGIKRQKITLLSEYNAREWLASGTAWDLKPTEYAKAKMDMDDTDWWLITPWTEETDSYEQVRDDKAAIVTSQGEILIAGCDLDEYHLVRPVIWFELEE